MKTPLGPKSLQLRALRERNFEQSRMASRSVAASTEARVALLKKLTEVATSKPVKPPVQASANPKESKMAKKSKSASKSKVSKPKPAKRSRSKKAAKVTAPAAEGETKSDGPRPGTKLEVVSQLLQRPEGCTVADVLAATNWPSVSMPQQAKAAGLTLSKEKDGKVSRYRGTPLAA